jgi:hypothetical protein
MYTRTLAQLVTSLLIRGGYERSSDITKTVAGELINDALEESYDIIVSRWDDYYTTISPTFTTVANVDTYALPNDFYKLRKVEMLVSGVASDPAARWTRLFSIDIDDAHHQRSTQYPAYRLTRAGIVLVPGAVAAGQTLRAFYIPAAPQLVFDTDTVQFDTPTEQKLVIHIALRDCYQRQDLPTQEIEGKIIQLTGMLRSASDHDAGEPFYLTRRTGDGDPDEDRW